MISRANHRNQRKNNPHFHQLVFTLSATQLTKFRSSSNPRFSAAIDETICQHYFLHGNWKLLLLSQSSVCMYEYTLFILLFSWRSNPLFQIEAILIPLSFHYFYFFLKCLMWKYGKVLENVLSLFFNLPSVQAIGVYFIMVGLKLN